MNAFTAKEYTCYYARVLDTDLPLAIDVVCDMLTGSVLDRGRGRRRRTRRHPRRDRDDRGRPGRLRPRPLRAHHARRLPARPPRPGHRRDRQRAHPRPHRPLLPASTTTRRTWSSPPRATSTTTPSSAQVRAAFDRAGALDRTDATPSPVGPRSGVRTVRTAGRVELLDRRTEQAHLVLGMPGVSAQRRPPLGARRAQHGPRRRHELPPLPGDPREARPRLQRVLLHLRLRRLRPLRRLRGLPPQPGRRRAQDLPRRAGPGRPARPARRRAAARRSASCPAPRCSAWRTPAR